MGIHECDIFIVNKRLYCTEIEIKVTLVDLKKDLLKPHKHESNLIRELWFAIPESLLKHIDLIPSHAGILTVHEGGYSDHKFYFLNQQRRPIRNKNAVKLDIDDLWKLGKLAAQRVWSLRKKYVRV
jgi:hypothetical protein